LDYFEVKFRGPDGVVFDIANKSWPGAEPLPKRAKETADA
jgi:hypothetical protein